jgi:hypothetical protein
MKLTSKGSNLTTLYAAACACFHFELNDRMADGSLKTSITQTNVNVPVTLSTLSIVLVDILGYIMTALASWLRLLGRAPKPRCLPICIRQAFC